MAEEGRELKVLLLTLGSALIVEIITKTNTYIIIIIIIANTFPEKGLYLNLKSLLVNDSFIINSRQLYRFQPSGLHLGVVEGVCTGVLL